jgi:hypothetical protein
MGFATVLLLYDLNNEGYALMTPLAKAAIGEALRD